MARVSNFKGILADSDQRWNNGWSKGTPVTITYSFTKKNDLPGLHELPYFASEIFSFSKKQQRSTEKALEEFADAAGFHFVETKGEAMMQFYGVSGSSWGGWANYPLVYDSYVDGSEIVVDGKGSYRPGTGEYQTLLHEIGHAVGLKHPHEGDPILKGKFDKPSNTVMTYEPGDFDDLGYLDKDAVKHLYGRSQDTDDWSYKWKNDVLVQRLSNDDDKILGIEGKNKILGGKGNDKLLGRHDDDQLLGEKGNDKLWGDDGDDDLNGGNGKDKILAGWGQDKASGGKGSDKIFGEFGDDHLAGGSGNDFISGGPGDDILLGGAGKDVLSGDSGDDVLRGGADADVFKFSLDDAGDHDTILDYELGLDSLDLTETPFQVSDAAIYNDFLGAVMEFAGFYGFSITFSGIDADDLIDSFAVA